MDASLQRSAPISSILVVCLLVFTAAFADVQALPGGGGSVPIRLNRFGAVNIVEITETVSVDDGDMLFCEDSGRTLQLRSTQVSSGVGPEPFRFMVIPTEKRLFINLLEGELVSDTDAGVTVIVGDQLIGATGTRFLVSRTIEDGSPVAKCLVFEGSVEIRGAGTQEPRRIGRRERWVRQRGDSEWGRVSDAELNLAADRFARIALETRPGVALEPEVVSELSTRYRALFVEPNDPQVQLELVDFKLNNGVTFGVSQDLGKLRRNPEVERDAALRERSRAAVGVWTMLNGSERDALATIVRPDALRALIDRPGPDEPPELRRAVMLLERSAVWNRQLLAADQMVTADPRRALEMYAALSDNVDWPELHAGVARAYLMLEMPDRAASSTVAALRADATQHRLRETERDALWRLLGHVWLRGHVTPADQALTSSQRFADAGLYGDAVRALASTRMDNVSWIIGGGLLARMVGDTKEASEAASAALAGRVPDRPSWVRPMVELLARPAS